MNDKSKMKMVFSSLLGKEYIIIKQFQDQKLGKVYEVYLVKYNDILYVVKKTTQHEILIFTRYFNNHHFNVAYILNQYLDLEGNYWILTNYFNLKDARHRNAKVMKQCANAIAQIHASYLYNTIEEDLDTDRTVRYLLKKQKSLQDYPLLYDAASVAIKRVQTAPVTLCHEDLLPINILCDENQAVIVDFEEAYFLAYFFDPARFVTHYDNDNLFYVSKSSQEAFLHTYFQRIKKECTDLTRKQFYFDINCGRFLEAMIVFVNMDNKENNNSYELYFRDLNHYAKSILQIK
ncbi:MAG: phosphotransferase [Candidatus Izemoplasmatales bacterium]